MVFIQVEVALNEWHTIEVIQQEADTLVGRHHRTKTEYVFKKLNHSLLSYNGNHLPFFETFTPNLARTRIELLWIVSGEYEREEWIEAEIQHHTNEMVEFESENLFLPVSIIRYKNSPVLEDNDKDHKVAFIDEQNVFDVSTGVVVGWKYFGEEFIDDDEESKFFGFTKLEADTYLNETIPKLIAKAIEPHRISFDNLPVTVQNMLGADILRFKTELTDRLRSVMQYDKFGYEVIMYHDEVNKAFEEVTGAFRKMFQLHYEIN